VEAPLCTHKESYIDERDDKSIYVDASVRYMQRGGQEIMTSVDDEFVYFTSV